MSTQKMHTGEVDIDSSLVGRLLAAQFPYWADLPVTPAMPQGWDNRTFRLGERMTVRLPSAERYVAQVEKEHRWLPQLAPHLPLPIPVPLARGAPAEDFPWPWSVYRWIEGETATIGRIGDLVEFATTLADFLVTLQHIDPTGGPTPGPHNFFRGGSLTVYDSETRQALAALDGEIDTRSARAVWESALDAAWHGPPVWFHGDIAWGNLLVEEGRLSAVIDFGTSGVGDPSCDLAISWTLFGGESREAFRAVLQPDDATWARGRGWTLWKALITLTGSADSGSQEPREPRQVIEEVLDDYDRSP
jgi:aminoglycoside phosphotransferase (APT) family kinase protein